ncbi:MAG: stage III sporulation protein AC [Clostridia bacterium]|nr:stage III sporulation protein AC [Clostridia bacterium]
MQLDLLFQIAGIGILTTVVSAVLASSGRSELANLATVAGLAIVLLMVVNLLSELFTSVRTIFQLY